VSLEDDLMRIFSSDRVRDMMEKLGVPEDVPIENRVVSKALESAQRRVEGHNFDIRKHLVEYDDVINKHRDTIYRMRSRALDTFDTSKENTEDELSKEIFEMIEQEIEATILFHTKVNEEGDWDTKEITEVLKTIYPVSDEVTDIIKNLKEPTVESEMSVEDRTALIESIVSDAKNAYDALRENIIKQVGNDGGFLEVERTLMLRAVDTLWIEHLEAMDHLRQGIGLRGYGQRDPLVEYKKEAYRLFNELLDLIRKQVVYTIFKVSVALKAAPSLYERQNVTLSAPAKTMSSNKGGAVSSSAPTTQNAASSEKVGRNEPCPCGSGKKYKKCHGQ